MQKGTNIITVLTVASQQECPGFGASCVQRVLYSVGSLQVF